MQAQLTSTLTGDDRKVLWVVGAVFLVLTAASLVFSPSAETSAIEFPSTYSSAPGGARAAYLLMKELDYTVERWERPGAELPQDASGVVLILAEPAGPFSKQDTYGLRQFLRSGGLILATGLRAAQALPEEAAAGNPSDQQRIESFSARLPSPFTRGAATIELHPGVYWGTGSPSHVVLYGNDARGVVVTYAFGAGRVIWWASATPLTNAGILASQNLALFLNVLGRPGEKRILWEEYSHGLRGSIWTYFARTPIPWGMAQLGAMALALLLTFGRRSGPVRPLAGPSRLSPLEFVEALGGLYYRAHAARAAVGVALQRFRCLLARRLGLPAGLATQELARAANARLGNGAEFLETTLRAAERASFQPHLADAQALELVQTLDSYAERLAIKPVSSLPQRARAVISAGANSSSSPWESNASLKEPG